MYVWAWHNITNLFKVDWSLKWCSLNVINLKFAKQLSFIGSIRTSENMDIGHQMRTDTAQHVFSRVASTVWSSMPAKMTMLTDF